MINIPNSPLFPLSTANIRDFFVSLIYTKLLCFVKEKTNLISSFHFLELAPSTHGC